ncbi:MAG: GumC family protein [Nitrospirae bacterium]|nr:GumC family protein [Nitrospirota bacterium]
MQFEDYRKELLTVLFAQKRLIVAVTVFVFTCAVLIAFFWPPTYASYGTVLIKIKRQFKNPEALEKSDIRYSPVTPEDLSSEVEILTSHDVIEMTIDSLKKRNLYRPEGGGFLNISLLLDIILPDKQSDKKQFNKEVYNIKKKLQTKVVEVSNAIEVTFHSNDPAYAVTFLDALLNEYIKYRMKIYYPDEAETYFTKGAGGFGEEIDKKRKDWISMIEKNKISDPSEELKNNLLIKKELETQLNTLRNSAIEKKMQIEYLETALKKEGIQFFSFIDKSAIANLSTSLQDIFMEYGKVLRVYTQSSDKASPVEKQMRDTLNVLRSEIRIYKDGLASELETLNKQIAAIKNEISNIVNWNVELQKQNITTQKIQFEMDLLKQSYDTFSKRREEAVQGSTSPTSMHISILSKAFLSNGPVFPKKIIVIPLGFIIGLLMGCSLAFVKEYFDHTFKKISDAEKMGLRVIFSIPDFTVKEKPAQK